MPHQQRTDRILGIDPGLNVTGYGVIDVTDGQVTLVEAGIVRSKPKASLAARVREIHEGIVDVIETTRPTAVAVEELYSHYERPKTAILMGHARGVLILAAASSNLPVKHYAATRIKKILAGNGRAPKSQVQSAIQREFGLEQLPEPHDVSDALAIALCHYYLRDSEQHITIRPTTTKRPTAARRNAS